MDDIFDTDVEDIPKGAHRFDPTPEELTRVAFPPDIDEQGRHAGKLGRKWKAETPPSKRYLVQNLIPMGKLGMISAAGGTGKSMLVNQLVYSVATGTDWCGRFNVPNPGPVLLINGEDDEEELHHRFHIIENWDAGHPVDPNHLDRMYPNCFPGADLALVSKLNGGIVRNKVLIQWIIDYAKHIDAVLMVLDPLASFMGIDENSNSDAQAFVVTMRHIVKETGATVLMVHHTNKTALMQGATAQGSHRGASAFVDGSRFAFGMATMTNPKDYGITEADRKHYVALELNKTNYSPPGDKVWLERGSGGYLTAVDLQLVAKETKADSPELHEAIIAKLKEDAEQGKYHSKTGFPNAFQGTKAMLGNGQYSIRGALNQLLESGDLVIGEPPKPIHNKPEVLLLPVG